MMQCAPPRVFVLWDEGVVSEPRKAVLFQKLCPSARRECSQARGDEEEVRVD